MNFSLNKLGAFFGVALLATAVYCLIYANKLDNQDLAIVQAFTGETVVRRDPGWWIQCAPTIWKYPKAGVYSLNGKDGDTLRIQFNSKSTADLSCMIGYRLDDTNDVMVLKLHQQVEGNDDKIWRMVLSEVNTIAQCVASQFDPSEVIGGEKFPDFVNALSASVIHNESLLKQGIDINVFKVNGKPEPDPDTKRQFNEQREAALAKELAKSQVKKLEAETEKERAEAARKTEHEKIEAQALMAKEKLDYERQKQNEVIAAQKKLELAKLAKQEAEIKAMQEAEVAKIEAGKVREVAEIEKQTEAARLEREKLIAEQIKVAALAKKEQIEKSGAITEKEKTQLEIDMRTKIGVAEAYGKALSSATLPQIMVVGNSGSDGKSVGTNPFDILLQTMTLEKLNAVQPTAVK